MIILIFVSAFIFMEFVAWSNHKYIMHGFLWSLHKDHHVNVIKKQKGFFEKNDLFFLIYAIPAIILILTGIINNNAWFISAGAGITLYGFTYFILHDVVYHKRLPLFGNVKNRYIKAVIRAHDAHHRPSGKDDFNNFGLLVFSGRYFK